MFCAFVYFLLCSFVTILLIYCDNCLFDIRRGLRNPYGCCLEVQ